MGPAPARRSVERRGGRGLRRSAARRASGRRRRPRLAGADPRTFERAAGRPGRRPWRFARRAPGAEGRRGGFRAQSRAYAACAGARAGRRDPRARHTAPGDRRHAYAVRAHDSAPAEPDRRAGRRHAGGDSGLPHAAHDRRRRHGAGLPRRTGARRPAAGAQGPRPGPAQQRHLPAAFRARVQPDRVARERVRGAHLRSRLLRRPPVHRHGVPVRRHPRRAHPGGHDLAGGAAPDLADRQGAGCHPRARHRAPGPEAAEHHVPRQRAPGDRRFRPGEGPGFDLQPDRPGRGHGHARAT